MFDNQDVVKSNDDENSQQDNSISQDMTDGPVLSREQNPSSNSDLTPRSNESSSHDTISSPTQTKRKPAWRVAGVRKSKPRNVATNNRAWVDQKVGPFNRAMCRVVVTHFKKKFEKKSVTAKYQYVDKIIKEYFATEWPILKDNRH